MGGFIWVNMLDSVPPAELAISTPPQHFLSDQIDTERKKVTQYIIVGRQR